MKQTSAQYSAKKAFEQAFEEKYKRLGRFFLQQQKFRPLLNGFIVSMVIITHVAYFAADFLSVGNVLILALDVIYFSFYPKKWKLSPFGFKTNVYLVSTKGTIKQLNQKKRAPLILSIGILLLFTILPLVFAILFLMQRENQAGDLSIPMSLCVFSFNLFLYPMLVFYRTLSGLEHQYVEEGALVVSTDLDILMKVYAVKNSKHMDGEILKIKEVVKTVANTEELKKLMKMIAYSSASQLFSAEETLKIANGVANRTQK